DEVLEDDEWECKTHEKTEIKMHKHAIEQVIERSNKQRSDVDCIIGGDLLNQLVATNFAVREFEIPIIGVYSACASFGEAVGLAMFMLGRGNMRTAVCCTGSHFGAVERQFRYPLELGTQPTPASQYTVTGVGSILLSLDSKQGVPKLTHCTIGKIVDLEVSDPNNMGAAMAPAAADTILTHLKDTGRGEDYYDYIFRVDLV
ncbi:MAG: stage V sporulation protein AD, partial [Clostridia bacterium]|nr:stage V sporulation protein AD [Clostridia bacterium]